MNFRKKSKVYIIGAGPGDPNLLTIKAADILRKADVVITDRLVSKEILDAYVNKDALIIPVGKQSGSSASTSQKEINRLLVKMAERFDCVVRLKGGDVSIFSNIFDELQTLNQAHISYEIIPGISAISGAAAYTGIPLTARNFSTGVRILTYYESKAIDESLWKELATFKETLVFYMSANILYEAVDKLLKNDADENIPFVVVEQATTHSQHVFGFTLQSFILQHSALNFRSPSIIIMGKVAALYDGFSWLPNNSKRNSFFEELKEKNTTNFENHYQINEHVN